MGKRSYCRASVAVLLLATVLQFAAIVAPGWAVYIRGNLETYEGVFFKVTCSLMPSETCSVKSHLDKYTSHRDALVDVKVSRTKLALVDNEYYKLVYKQVLLVVAAVLSLLAFLLQACRKGKVDKTHTRLTVVSIITSALSVGIVLTIVAGEFVQIAYDIEMLSHDTPGDHTYLGFPFCIAMMLGSVLLHVVAQVTMGAHLYNPKEVGKKRQRIPSVSYSANGNGPEPVPEKTTKYQYDNTILSEKL